MNTRTRRTSTKVMWIIGFAFLWMCILGRRYFVTGTLERLAEPEHAYPHHEDDYRRRGELQRGGKALESAPAVTMWHGVEVPTTEEWDFYGLKVPLTPALSRVKKGQVGSDYDLSKVNASQIPRGYEYGTSPAYRFPDPNERLFATVSTIPRVLFFPQIITDEEVELILQEAAPRLKRSQVAVTKDGRKQGKSETQEARTSHSTWVNLEGKLENLHKRLSTVVGTTWHEPLNVLRYEFGQHYDAHHDYFDPSYYGEQENNRMATFYLYLSDTEEGGATTIPRANAGKMPMNYKDASCHQGIQVYPRKGSGVLFYDMRPDLSLDEYSLHGACDVIKGVKWGGPVWFRAKTPQGTGRNKPYQY